MGALAEAPAQKVQPSFFVPFRGFTEGDDGRLILEGIATDETVDSDGMRIDFDASVEAFEDWIGNIREMHQLEAVGKRLAVEIDRELREIILKGFITTGAPNTIQKIRDGVLIGWSVGFDFLEKDVVLERFEGRLIPTLKRYKLREISVVDEPANPRTQFRIVKVKNGQLHCSAFEEDRMEDPKETTEETTEKVTTPPAKETGSEEAAEKPKKGEKAAAVDKETVDALRAVASRLEAVEDRMKSAEKAANRKVMDEDEDEKQEQEEEEDEKIDMATTERMIEAMTAMMEQMAAMKDVLMSSLAGGDEEPAPDQGEERRDRKATKPQATKSKSSGSGSVAEVVGEITKRLVSIDSRLERIESTPVHKGFKHAGGPMTKVLAGAGIEDADKGDEAFAAELMAAIPEGENPTREQLARQVAHTVQSRHYRQ